LFKYELNLQGNSLIANLLTFIFRTVMQQLAKLLSTDIKRTLRGPTATAEVSELLNSYQLIYATIAPSTLSA